MANTKIPSELSNTPSISDSGDATAITIDSSENVTLSNDLTVDTNTLHVDSTNNRVGVGTTSPAAELHVSGDSIANTFKLIANSSVSGSDATIFRPADNTMAFSTNGAERARIASDGAFGIANSNPHFDLDTNEARLGYYSSKGLGYNFFTTSINFSSGTSTKYIAISYGTGLFYNLDLDLHGQYGNFNAEGGIRKVYIGGVNATDGNIYGNGNAQLFSLGNTATYYSTGTAAKSGTAKIRIPITGTSLPAADTLHVGIKMFGIHLDRITSIAIE